MRMLKTSLGALVAGLSAWLVAGVWVSSSIHADERKSGGTIVPHAHFNDDGRQPSPDEGNFLSPSQHPYAGNPVVFPPISEDSANISRMVRSQVPNSLTLKTVRGPTRRYNCFGLALCTVKTVNLWFGPGAYWHKFDVINTAQTNAAVCDYVIYYPQGEALKPGKGTPSDPGNIKHIAHVEAVHGKTITTVRHKFGTGSATYDTGTDNHPYGNTQEAVIRPK